MVNSIVEDTNKVATAMLRRRVERVELECQKCCRSFFSCLVCFGHSSSLEAMKHCCKFWWTDINSSCCCNLNVFCLDCWTHPEFMVDFLSQPQPCWRHWRQSESFTQAKNFQVSDGQRCRDEWKLSWFDQFRLRPLWCHWNSWDSRSPPSLLRSVSVFACILWNWGPGRFHNAMFLKKNITSFATGEQNDNP